MPDDDASPSTGWRGVYAVMGVPTSAEDRRSRGRGNERERPTTPAPADRERTRDCPTCGGRSRSVRPGVYACPEHGRWGASATG